MMCTFDGGGVLRRKKVVVCVHGVVNKMAYHYQPTVYAYSRDANKTTADAVADMNLCCDNHPIILTI